MPRLYRVSFQGTLTVTGGDSDLLEIQPADDKPCRLVGMRIGQLTRVGDAGEVGLRFDLIHMGATFTSGSGGSSVTPARNAPGVDVAAAFVAECNNTTIATTSGTTTTMEYIEWNVRNSPFETFWFDEDLMATAIQAEALLVRSQTTPPVDITFAVTFFVRELP
jgi:hypothetical protein